MLLVVDDAGKYVADVLDLFVAVLLCCDLHPGVVLVVHDLEHVYFLQGFVDLLQHFGVFLCFALLLEFHVFEGVEGLWHVYIDVVYAQVI